MDPIVKTFSSGISYEFIEYYSLEAQWLLSNEPESLAWVDEHVLPDWTVIDAGAHIGLYTMLLSIKAIFGKVIAFEPCKKTLSMLAKNLAYNQGRFGNDFRNVHVEPIALGSKVERNKREILYLTDGTNEYGKTEDLFNFTTIDDYAIVRQFNRLDFIKIDVDGWDYDVLLGAAEMLQKFRPYVIVEVNSALEWRGHNGWDVHYLLANLGYDHRVVDPTPNNWLCWPKEKSA